MSQTIAMVGTSRHGSTIARPGSGKRSMSLSWIFWKPRIDEPSNPIPSSKSASFSSPTGMLKCCQVPGRSVKRRSTILVPASFAFLMTSFGVAPAAVFSSVGIHFPLHRLADGPLPCGQGPAVTSG